MWRYAIYRMKWFLRQRSVTNHRTNCIEVPPTSRFWNMYARFKPDFDVVRGLPYSDLSQGGKATSKLIIEVCSFWAALNLRWLFRSKARGKKRNENHSFSGGQQYGQAVQSGENTETARTTDVLSKSIKCGKVLENYEPWIQFTRTETNARKAARAEESRYSCENGWRAARL